MKEAFVSFQSILLWGILSATYLYSIYVDCLLKLEVKGKLDLMYISGAVTSDWIVLFKPLQKKLTLL